MNILFVFSLVLMITIENVENYCQINTKELLNVPIFLETFGLSHRFISIEKNGMLNLKNGRSIIATCGGSVFTINDGQNQTKTHNINIYCKEDMIDTTNNNNKNSLIIEYVAGHVKKSIVLNNNKLPTTISPRNNSINDDDVAVVAYNNNNNLLSCDKNVIQFFNYNVKGCDKHTGILAGFINRIYGNSTDERQLIKLIEYCYDESQLRTIFANHIIAARSPFIEHQSQYNTGHDLKLLSTAHYDGGFIEPVPDSIVELFSGNIEKLYDQNRLRKHFESILGNVYSNIALSKVNIVPEHTLPLQFKTAATDIYLNSAIQWTGLRDGNWCKLQDDIKNIAKYELASVYTGTSGVIGVYDSWNKFQHLFVNTEQMLEASMPVPLYYWTVIRTQPIYDDDDDKVQINQNNYKKEYSDENAVVILSINNPYLKVTDLKSYIFCTDICDYIPWLNMLKVTRKMPALGYTFCCHLSEAMDYIPEIPKHCMEEIKIDADDDDYIDGTADDKIVNYISSHNNNNINIIKDNDKEKHISDYIVKRDSDDELKKNVSSSDEPSPTRMAIESITQLNDDNKNADENEMPQIKYEEKQNGKTLSLLIDVGEEALYDHMNGHDFDNNDDDDDDDADNGDDSHNDQNQSSSDSVVSVREKDIQKECPCTKSKNDNSKKCNSESNSLSEDFKP